MYTLISTTGQDAYGYLELYKNDELRGERSAVTVFYMPEGFNEHPNARVVVTILTELPKGSFSKSKLHDIMCEIEEVVKQNAPKYFKNPMILSYMDTVTLHVGNIDDVEEITHGDYGFIS